ncbi:response regulator [Polaromonas sp.]|uniref:response regulator n=1 Tax=Polaromonas sp. TaxID=1869339 RepID=UPI0013B78D19|nr:response regulator [Polaromonas sp.]NDP64163.1 response regulator [Polaromonas sp.]
MRQLHPEVWVVDDEEINRILARAYLERLGWEVREFANSDDVLRCLKQARPLAMLLDVRMPGLPGDELVRQIRSLFPQDAIRIVGYTAHCMEDALLPVMAAGFDQVLIKPVSFQQMANALPLKALS